MFAQNILLGVFLVCFVAFVIQPLRVTRFREELRRLIQRNGLLLACGLLAGSVSLLHRVSAAGPASYLDQLLYALLIVPQSAVLAAFFMGYPPVFLICCLRGELARSLAAPTLPDP